MSNELHFFNLVSIDILYQLELYEIYPIKITSKCQENV